VRGFVFHFFPQLKSCHNYETFLFPGRLTVGNENC